MGIACLERSQRVTPPPTCHTSCWLAPNRRNYTYHRSQPRSGPRDCVSPRPRAAWRALTVEAETGDPDSMLEFYRHALRIRCVALARGEPMSWLPAPAGVLAFTRGPAVCCVVNLCAVPVDLPAHSAVLLASGPLAGGLLPPDTAAWLRA